MVEQFPNITDISDDEIGNSQPISLPSSSHSDCREVVVSVRNRPPKRTGQKGNFRSIEEIDSKYRHVFSYPFFNFVQSSVIEDALYTDKSMVISAPTGSGKTVVFEMAIVHLLMELEDNNYTDDFKIIYMAPVKALCTERLTEWYPKFNRLGLLCIEVTGDTDVEFPQLKPYRIIITTPEKWDMLTRRWKDHRSLVEVIKLFLIDEVHILNDEIRGPVLEAVVSRMKTIESSVQSAHRIEKLKAQYQGTDPISTSTNTSVARIRFVAVSATVGNPDDVAAWLGTKDRQAVYHKFGDECRPVKLKRVVEGYPCAEGTSIFKFDVILCYKLWPIIQKYNNGKPTLIFCNTRKGVVLTAETLSKAITVSYSAEQRMKLTALASTIKTKKIQSLIMSGIGCHHAGLLFEERMNIERAFRNRELPILVTTTTLAMGVNLPAHLVIVKNTQQYVNGAYQEYSISTVLQMVGRAGRPQFDSEATAVIMTRLQDKARYQALVGGSEPLQSYLHKRLAENLNSEAALGTVGDVAQCVQWLNSTFLSVRAARDPKRYLGLTHAAPAQLISKKLEELCVKAMNALASAGLITMDEASCIESTEAGRLMSVYYLDLETMKLIMKLEGAESLEQLLWLVCESHELSDMHLRVDERRCLNALNRNNAAATIRYPMKGKINSRQMKLNCIIQAVLGCLPIPDPALNQEAMKIMRIADRVCKCLVSYVTRPNFVSQRQKFFTTILNSLILAKCISKCLWENSPYISRQLKGIGPTFSALLATAGKVNFMLLGESHPRDLERIMNKGPPAGNILRKQISLLPMYNLIATPINERTVEIKLSLLNHAFLAENLDKLTAGIHHKSTVIVGDSDNCLLYFTNFTDSNLINVYDGCMTFNITRSTSREQKIFGHCISSSFVGIDAQCQYLFKDINISFQKIENPLHSSFVSSKNTTQQASSDIGKIRKRKTQSEVTQSNQIKEKKKRETELISKFNVLKKPFEKAPKEIKVIFNETAEMPNKILEDLTKPENNSNKASRKPEQPDVIFGSDNFQDEFRVDLEFDDFVDNQQVNDILDDIEKEIKIGEDKSVPSTSYQINPWPQNIQSYKNDSNTINYNISKGKRFNKKRSISNKQTNYNFLDKLEKSLNNEYDTAEIENNNGFSSAVKFKLENYLERTNNANRTKTNAIDNILEPIVSSVVEKNIEQYDKEDNIINDAKKGKDKCEVMNTFHSIKQHRESDYIDKDIKASGNQCSKYEKNMINEYVILNNDDIVTSELILPVSQNNFFNNYEVDSKKIVTIKSQEITNIVPSNAQNVLMINKKKLIMDIPDIPESITSVKTISVPNSNDLDNLNHFSHLSNNNDIESFTELPELPENDCLMACSSNNPSTNLNSTTLTKTNTIEYMKYHSLKKTNYFNTTIENINKQKVHLIGKLEINLNLAEIISSNDKSEVNAEPQNAEINENSDITYIYNSDAKQLKLNANKNIMEICGTTHSMHYNENLELYTKDKNENLEDSVDKESKLPKSNQSVTDILQKYKHIVKGRSEIGIKNDEEALNKDKKIEINSAERYMRPKRKYKIRDLENLDIDFPESLISRNEEPATFINRNAFNNTCIRNSTSADHRDQNNICNMKYETDDLENNLSQKFISAELTNTDFNLDISEAVLNPKLLLLKVTQNNNEGDIIPPPPEFDDFEEESEELMDTDFNLDISEAVLNPKRLLQSVRNDNNEKDTISPSTVCNDLPLHEDKNCVEHILESKYYANESKQREDTSFETSEIALDPSREEKWTISPNTQCELILNPTVSWTAMHNNIIEKKNTSTFFKTRTAKLSEFKFKRKNILHK